MMGKSIMTTVFLMAIIAITISFLCSNAFADDNGASAAKISGSTTADRFEKKITVTVGSEYLIHLPEAYDKDPQKKWPLILFLHGAGERGNDIQRVRIHGPINYAEKNPDFPFIIVSPQCPQESWWDKRVDVLINLLDHIQEAYRVDPDRIYLTGLSMGGFGSWALAIEHPDRFAAVAPICGGGTPFLAGNMKDVPVWAFHGAIDNVVPLSATEAMIDALKRNGADPKLTVYPDLAHDSWTVTYNNPELYEWFLKHSRADRQNQKSAIE